MSVIWFFCVVFEMYDLYEKLSQVRFDCERVKEMRNVSHSWQNTLLAGNELFHWILWYTLANFKKIDLNLFYFWLVFYTDFYQSANNF